MGRRETRITVAVVLLGASLLTACARGNEPAAPHATAPSGSAARYMNIAEPANRRLEIDFDRLAGPDRFHLADALADLRDAASTERTFDRDLLRLSLPPDVEVTAQDLVRANESRVKLTSGLSAYGSLEQLKLGEKSLAAANGAVEAVVRSVRRKLGLPPPQTN